LRGDRCLTNSDCPSDGIRSKTCTSDLRCRWDWENPKSNLGSSLEKGFYSVTNFPICFFVDFSFPITVKPTAFIWILVVAYFLLLLINEVAIHKPEVIEEAQRRFILLCQDSFPHDYLRKVRETLEVIYIQLKKLISNLPFKIEWKEQDGKDANSSQQDSHGEATLIQLLKIQQQDAALQQQNAAFQEQNAALQEQNSALQQQNVILHEQNPVLHEQNAVLHEQNAVLQEQNASLQEKIRNMEEQLNETRLAKSIAEKQKKVVEDERDRSTEEICELKKEMKILQESRTPHSLEDEINSSMEGQPEEGSETRERVGKASENVAAQPGAPFVASEAKPANTEEEVVDNIDDDYVKIEQPVSFCNNSKQI